MCGILFARFRIVDYVSDQGEKKGVGKRKSFLKIREKKIERKTLFVSNTLCSRLQHTYRQRMAEENISLKCTVLARDRFYQILLEHLEAKLKVEELIITDTGHKIIIQKNLNQILIQKLTFEQNKQNVSNIVTKRSAADINKVRRRSTFQSMMV